VDLRGEIPLVIDHKTTKNPYYALTPEKLRQDPQAVIYAATIFARVPNASGLILRWVYYGTNKLGAFKVEAKVTKSEIDTKFRDILRRSSSMPILRGSSTDARGIPRNLNHCTAFGGCPFMEQCANYGEEENMSDIFEKLRKAKQAPATETIAEGVNPPSSEPEIIEATVEKEAPKRKRGRPKKAEPKPAAAPVVSNEDKPQMEANDGSWFALYIGCVPVGETIQLLEPVLLDIADAAAAAHDLTHWKLAEYGKGPSYLADALRDYMADKPLSGNYYVDSKSRLFQELGDQLVTRAVRVIRATF